MVAVNACALQVKERFKEAIARVKEALCSFGAPPDASHGHEQVFALPDGSKIEITPEVKHACRKLPEEMFFGGGLAAEEISFESTGDAYPATTELLHWCWLCVSCLGWLACFPFDCGGP